MGRPHCRSVEELLDTLTNRELIEWQEWFAIEPWHDGHDDAVAATIATAAASILGALGARKHGSTVEPADILPQFKGQPARRTVRRSIQEQQSHLIGLTLAGGGTIACTDAARARMDAEMQGEAARIDAWMAQQQARWRREHGRS